MPRALIAARSRLSRGSRCYPATLPVRIAAIVSMNSLSGLIHHFGIGCSLSNRESRATTRRVATGRQADPPIYVAPAVRTHDLHVWEPTTPLPTARAATELSAHVVGLPQQPDDQAERRVTQSVGMPAPWSVGRSGRRLPVHGSEKQAQLVGRAHDVDIRVHGDAGRGVHNGSPASVSPCQQPPPEIGALARSP